MDYCLQSLDTVIYTSLYPPNVHCRENLQDNQKNDPSNTTYQKKALLTRALTIK